MKKDRIILSIAIILAIGLPYHFVSLAALADYAALLGAACLIVLYAALFIIFKPSLGLADFKRKKGRLIGINITLLVIAAASYVLFSTMASLGVALWAYEHLRPWGVTNGIIELRWLLICIAILIGTLSFIKVIKGNSERFVTLVHAMGYAVFLTSYQRIWRDMETVSVFWDAVEGAVLIYGVAALLVIATIILLIFLRKGAVKHGDNQ